MSDSDPPTSPSLPSGPVCQLNLGHARRHTIATSDGALLRPPTDFVEPNAYGRKGRCLLCIDPALRCAERDTSVCGIHFLRRFLGRLSQRPRSDDAVAIPVRRHRAGIPSPLSGCRPARGLPESASPRLPREQILLENSLCPSLNQRLTFLKSSTESIRVDGCLGLGR